MNTLRTVTNSEITTRRRCAREHFYAYVMCMRPLEDVEALRFGTAWHLAMEAYWKGMDADSCFRIAAERLPDPFEQAKLRVLLAGYQARWGEELMNEVVAVEQEFRAPIVNPETGASSRLYQLGGKLDVLLTDRYVEHKTSSEDIGFGSVYWRLLTLNSQVSTYHAGARSLGHDVKACIYDVVKKPSKRPTQIPLVDDGAKIVLDAEGTRVRTKDGKKWRETGDAEKGYVLQTRDETPDEYQARLAEDVAADPDKYFQRGEVVRLENEERESMLDIWNAVKSMHIDTLAGRHPRNSDACRRYNRLCPYMPVCTGEASLDDTTRFMQVDNRHQELTPDA
jgi:hypothetical protein